MSDEEWREAIRRGDRVSARWAYPHDHSAVRCEGHVIGYSADPMVLVQTDDGAQVWWAASLTYPRPTTGGEQ